MDFGLGSYGFGFLAGLLSTLSPCVLPIVPVLLGSAAAAHPRASLALASGLAISYAFIGTTIAWAGASLGMDTSIFRMIGAVIFGLLGIVLMSSTLQQRFVTATSGVGKAGNNMIVQMQLDGIWGQFVIGLVLGVIWSPCVGPTLGAAVVLASQGTHLPQVALLMGIFGVGAALPVLAQAYASREAMSRMRGKLMQVGKSGKVVMGGILIVIGVMILSGADKTVEAWLVDHSPEWITTLTTRF
jgi:cytochrome c-type biogenesis protein